MLAGIAYETFPDFEIGPITIRTFGTLVGIGVIVGAWIAARYVERFGVSREDTYRLATRMVVVGVIGSRLTWVLSHPSEIDNPVDVIALWEGGIQFSGGFIAALIVGYPTFRRWSRDLQLKNLDGYAYGLTMGLAIGRIGCYSVGEHFGRTTEFALGVTYEGGDVQEHSLGDIPLVEGITFHNTSLYELIHLVVLFGLMSLLLWSARSQKKELTPGVLVGLFTVWYGIGRFLTDTLRVNDERVLGLTGAQYMSLIMILAGLWILYKVRQQGAVATAGAGPELLNADSEQTEVDHADNTSDPGRDAETPADELGSTD